jgi:thioredoxin-related protein
MKFKSSRTILAAALLTSLLAGSGCQSTGEPSQATVKIFDEQASGKALLSEAMTKAKAENKQVLLLFGANWCPYCRALHGVIETDAAVREVVAKGYVVVPIDLGSPGRNRNAALADRYEAPVYTDGIPALVVTDANGKRVAPTKDNPWSAKNPIDAHRLMAFLKKAKP